MYEYFRYPYINSRHVEDFVLDKKRSVQSFKSYMYARLLEMFVYEGLPDTIPQRILEFYLISNGHCVISEVNSRLTVFIGSYGGEPNVYYEPTEYIISNPALNFSKSYKLTDKYGVPTDECVFCRNDKLIVGLNPLISRYAYLLAENLITIRSADIMLRVVAMLSAPDDKTKQAGEEYLRNIVNGKLGVIGENSFFDGIKLQSPPSNNGSYLTQFIELHQYLLGNLYNEIGLSAPYNMKREAINNSEVSLNEDTILPLIDSMLECRQDFVARVNEIYGTDISVDYCSVWKQNQIEQRVKLAQEFSELTNNQGIGNVSDQGIDNVSDQCIDNVSDQGIDNVSDQGIDNVSDQGIDNVSDQDIDLDLSINLDISAETSEGSDNELSTDTTEND